MAQSGIKESSSLNSDLIGTQSHISLGQYVEPRHKYSQRWKKVRGYRSENSPDTNTELG